MCFFYLKEGKAKGSLFWRERERESRKVDKKDGPQERKGKERKGTSIRLAETLSREEKMGRRSSASVTVGEDVDIG